MSSDPRYIAISVSLPKNGSFCLLQFSIAHDKYEHNFKDSDERKCSQEVPGLTFLFVEGYCHFTSFHRSERNFSALFILCLRVCTSYLLFVIKNKIKRKLLNVLFLFASHLRLLKAAIRCSIILKLTINL
jgi:hypothetical protein